MNLQPIVRKFRTALQRFPAITVKRNWHLRQILGLLRRITCLMTCEGEIYSFTHDVSWNTKTLIRPPDIMARKTTIANTGTSAAVIYENGKIVACVDAGESRELQLSGRFEIEAQTDSPNTTRLVITTHRRCPCGDDYVSRYGENVEPIGGDLI